jgi:hypothetical protein
MPAIGDKVETADGEIYLMVSEKDAPPVRSNGSSDTIARLLEQVNINLNILIDTNRWVGKYVTIEETLDRGVERRDFDFSFPIRYFKLYADQPIKIQFNDVGNPVISIDATEMPYVLSNLMPGFFIQKLYITTGTLATNLKILAIG